MHKKSIRLHGDRAGTKIDTGVTTLITPLLTIRRVHIVKSICLQGDRARTIIDTAVATLISLLLTIRQVHIVKSIGLHGDRTGTSIDRASSAQKEHMPSGRQSRNEYRYVPYRCSNTRRVFLEGSRIFFCGTVISCQSVVCYLAVNNRRHVFHWPTDRRQLSGRLLGISYPRACLCASSLFNVFFILRSSSHISILK